MNKRILSYLTAIVLVAFTTVNLFANPGSDVDLKTSQVTWKGYKVTGEHSGTINIKSANIEMKNNMLSGGSFEIDMSSITCTDMEGEYAGKLEKHLKSDDFFGVKTFPTASLNITEVKPGKKTGTYVMTGDLTIKKSTEAVTFEVTLKEGKAGTTAVAAMKIDRTKFDVRYGSGTFFENLGDKTIYDEFDLNVSLKLK